MFAVLEMHRRLNYKHSGKCYLIHFSVTTRHLYSIHFIVYLHSAAYPFHLFSKIPTWIPLLFSNYEKVLHNKQWVKCHRWGLYTMHKRDNTKFDPKEKNKLIFQSTVYKLKLDFSTEIVKQHRFILPFDTFASMKMWNTHLKSFFCYKLLKIPVQCRTAQPSRLSSHYRQTQPNITANRDGLPSWNRFFICELL